MKKEEESELIKELKKKEEEISEVKKKLKSLSYKNKIKKIINESKFIEFFRRKDVSPVLEKIEKAPEETKLETLALNSQKIEKPIEKSEFKYTFNLEEKKEIKYSENSKIMTNIVKKDFKSNTPGTSPRQTIEYVSTHESISTSVESYIPAEKVEDNLQRNISPREREILSKEEIKYKSSINQ